MPPTPRGCSDRPAAGPTAAGKTEVAVEVARRFDAVVVSADAMQVYRGMDVGTGKATAEERGEGEAEELLGDGAAALDRAGGARPRAG
jgi:cytidylate kinase